MTQYPSPYSMPPGGYPTNYQTPMSGDPLAPARRAGVMMIILGILAILGGGCFAGLGAVFTEQMWNEFLAKSPNPPKLPAGFSFSYVKLAITIGGAMVLVGGIVWTLLGIFVRGGNKGLVITSLVLNVLVLAWILVNIVVGAFQGGSEVIVGICLWIIPIAMLILTCVWLGQGINSRKRLAEIQQQYQQQMWQYQQQMQQYQQPPQAGYGYQYPTGQVPPPPPPPPSPPPLGPGN